MMDRVIGAVFWFVVLTVAGSYVILWLLKTVDILRQAGAVLGGN